MVSRTRNCGYSDERVVAGAGAVEAKYLIANDEEILMSGFLKKRMLPRGRQNAVH